MGGDPDREPPFFFTKPADALVTGGASMPYPSACASLHFELELVVAIGRAGRAILESDAPAHVWGHAVGLDMTRRDLQNAAKAGGPTLGHEQGLRLLRPDRRPAALERERPARSRPYRAGRSTARPASARTSTA